MAHCVLHGEEPGTRVAPARVPQQVLFPAAAVVLSRELFEQNA
jgi:hypothetical protein